MSDKKNVSRETSKFLDKYFNKPKHQEETISRVDDVDRSAYIPLDLQYANMMRQGAKANEMKDYTYNVDLARLEQAIKDKKFDKELFNTRIHKNMEKTEADYLMKEGLNRLDQYKDWRKEYDKAVDEWQRLEREKVVRQEAIKEYKASLEKPSNS